MLQTFPETGITAEYSTLPSFANNLLSSRDSLLGSGSISTYSISYKNLVNQICRVYDRGKAREEFCNCYLATITSVMYFLVFFTNCLATKSKLVNFYHIAS